MTKSLTRKIPWVEICQTSTHSKENRHTQALRSQTGESQIFTRSNKSPRNITRRAIYKRQDAADDPLVTWQVQAGMHVTSGSVYWRSCQESLTQRWRATVRHRFLPHATTRTHQRKCLFDYNSEIKSTSNRIDITTTTWSKPGYNGFCFTSVLAFALSQAQFIHFSYLYYLSWKNVVVKKRQTTFIFFLCKKVSLDWSFVNAKETYHL